MMDMRMRRTHLSELHFCEPILINLILLTNAPRHFFFCWEISENPLSVLAMRGIFKLYFHDRLMLLPSSLFSSLNFAFNGTVSRHWLSILNWFKLKNWLLDYAAPCCSFSFVGKSPISSYFPLNIAHLLFIFREN